MGNKNSSLLQDEEIKLIKKETGFSAAQIERLYTRFKSLDKSGYCGSLSRQDFLRVPELYLNPLCDRIVHMFFVDCDDEDNDRINFRQFMRILAVFRSPNHTSQSNPNLALQASQISKSLDELNQPNKNQALLDTISQSSAFRRLSLARHFRNFSFSFTDNSDNNFNFVQNRQRISHTMSVNHLSRHNGDIVNLKKGQRLPQMESDDEPINSRRNKLYFMFKIYDIDNDNLLNLKDLTATLKMLVGHYLDEITIDRIAEKNFNEIDKNNDGFIDFDEFCTFASFNRFNDESLKVKFPISA